MRKYSKQIFCRFLRLISVIVTLSRTRQWYDTQVRFLNKPNLYSYLKPAFHGSHTSVTKGNYSHPLNGTVTVFFLLRSQFLTGRVPDQN